MCYVFAFLSDIGYIGDDLVVPNSDPNSDLNPNSDPNSNSLLLITFQIISIRLQLSLLTKYGLGTKRTLDQLIAFTGMDVRAGVVFADRCKQLEWVPFQADKGA